MRVEGVQCLLQKGESHKFPLEGVERGVQQKDRESDP
jgi:hypothetical protein